MASSPPPPNPSIPPPGGEDLPPRPRRPRRFHSSDMWMFLAVAVMLILFVSGLAEHLIGLIYSPAALAVVVALLIQFFVLKARDRSRFYRLQLHMISNRRREDLCLLRETRDNLAEALETLRALREKIETQRTLDDESRAQLDRLREQIEHVHSDICRR